MSFINLNKREKYSLKLIQFQLVRTFYLIAKSFHIWKPSFSKDPPSFYHRHIKKKILKVAVSQNFLKIKIGFTSLSITQMEITHCIENI